MYAVVACLLLAVQICFCANLCPDGYYINVTKSNLSCVSSSDRNITCKNLSEALQLIANSSLKNPCIFLQDDQILKHHHILTKVGSILLVGLDRKINVTCDFMGSNISSKDVGISWINLDNVTLKNIAFLGCGIKNNTTYSLNGNIVPYMVTGLYLENVTNVIFKKVTLLQNLGYSTTIINALGSISFQTVIVRENKIPHKVDNKTVDGITFGGGGGVFINISVTSDKDLQFTDCLFLSNQGADISYHNESEPVPFGKGGGLTIMLGSSSTNVISFKNTRFKNNSAVSGGGLYLNLNNKESKVLFDSCQFSDNIAVNMGGGVFVLGPTLDQQSGVYVNCCNCLFHNNTAKIGGGYAFKLHSGKSVRNKNGTLFTESNFTLNSAVLGAAIYVYLTRLKLHHVQIKENKRYNSETVSEGAVVMYKSYLVLSGQDNFVTGNSNTAFIFDSTYFYVNGTVTFFKNKGKNGGAISMYGHSIVQLQPHANLVFKENVAEKKGGAMFIVVPGPPLPFLNATQLNRYDCFFNGSYGNVTFQSNKANSNVGSTIYASTLQNCLKNDSRFVDVFTDNKKWKNFHFEDAITNTIVSTAPTAIVLEPKEWENTSPGLYEQRAITLMDERGTEVSDAVDINIYRHGSLRKNVVKIAGGYKEFMVTKNKIKLALMGKINEKFNLTIINPDSGALSVTLINLTLGSCPFGFKYDKTQRICDCNQKKPYHNGIAQCLGGKIYLFKNRWAKPFQRNKDNETSQVCPENYCAECKSEFAIIECLYQQNNQCVEHRDQTSYLCSKCSSPRSSVLLSKGICEDCSGTYNWILMTFIHFIACFLATLGIVYLNRKTYASYLIPVIYSYQMMDLILPSGVNIDFFILFIVAIVSGSTDHRMYEVCFYDGLNDLTKFWVRYCSPFSWMLSWVIWLGISNIECARRYINRDSCFKAINALLVICCCDFFKFSFSVMKSVVIDEELRVYFYAEAKYGSAEHLPLLICAAISLTAIAVCLVVILVSTCRRSKETHFDSLPCCLWMKPVLDSFRYGFRNDSQSIFKDRTWFAPFYILCSCILISISILNDHFDKHTWQGIVCLIFMAIFIAAWPYQEDYMNYFDVVMLTNLAILAVVVDGSKITKYQLAVDIILYIPLVGLLIRLFYHIVTVHGLLQNCLRIFRDPRGLLFFCYLFLFFYAFQPGGVLQK